MITDLDVAVPLAIACLVISAFCSGTEVALFSIGRVERGQLAHSQRLTDRRIVATLERPRRLVAAVLIGNEACNSVLAVVAFTVLLQQFAIGPAMGLAIAVALPLIVLFSEITAKTLAAKAPRAWSRGAVWPLAVVAFVVAPVRIVVQAVTGLVLRPFGVVARQRPSHDLSEEEFRTLVDAGSAQGQVDARERRLIHRVFEFNDKNVGQIMTPRDRIFALSYDLPAQRLVKELAARGFSRVPIYQRSLDNIRGILNAKDLVRTTAGQPLGRPLVELLHEPLFVPRTTPVKRLFLTFKQKKVHMALVVSEYGKVLGLVTMDDVLAQIFGALRDERAELQNTIPPGRGPARVPGEVRPDGDASGAVGMAEPEARNDAPEPRGREVGEVRDGREVRSDARDGQDGLVRGELADRRAAPDPAAPGDRDRAAPASAAAGEGRAAAEEHSGPVSPAHGSTGESLGVLDPPPRPVHGVDEVTPPATDLTELERDARLGHDRSRSS